MPLVHKNDNIYVWIDLETTGLNPELDCILEVAVILTNNHLSEIERFESILVPNPNSIEQMNSFVRDMHTQNGLLDECQRFASLGTKDVEKDLREFLLKHKPVDGDLILVGNSIPSLDIPFLRKFMPELWNNCLHYRSIDISGVVEAIKLLYGVEIHTDKGDAHRAMGDVEACIGQAKQIKDELLDEMITSILKT